MKLYDAIGPNPRVVRMFLLEKGLEIPVVTMVPGTGDCRTPGHLARNPLGQVPVLETDDGQCICETLPICEFIEELHPEAPLVGRTPAERGETRMWARRVDLNICEPVMYGFRFSPVGSRLFSSRYAMSSEAALAMRDLARTNLAWLDGQLAGRSFLCGERFTLADILLFSFLQYGVEVGQLIELEWAALNAWFERVEARPSAAESAYSKVNSMDISGTV